MDTCIYMVESFCCSPETVITLLIDSTPTQNKKFFKKNSETCLILSILLKMPYPHCLTPIYSPVPSYAIK